MKTTSLFSFILLLIILTGCRKPDYQTISAPEFQELISDRAVQIIDARTPEEYRKGHIERAVNMDIQNENFNKQIQALDMDRPVAIYCNSGQRSCDAARKLADKGYKVYTLDNGWTDWMKYNYPEVTF